MGNSLRKLNGLNATYGGHKSANKAEWGLLITIYIYMAKQYKEYDRSLVESGKWTDLVESFKVGIYEIVMPNYSALRSLQVIVSRFNANMDYEFKFTTSVNYRNNPLVLRIEVDKRK